MHQDPSSLPQGTGCGKLILFGEHAVVWGAPALVTSLELGAHALLRTLPHEDRSSLTLLDASTRAELATLYADAEHGSPLERALATILHILPIDAPVHLDVTLHVPPGAGLGSSAAMAVAMARAIASAYPAAAPHVEQAVAASEAIFHASASGIDQAAAMGSGLIRFEKGPPSSLQPLHLPTPLELVICLAAPGASTARMVQHVLAQRQRHSALFEHLRGAVDAIVHDAIEALQRDDRAQLGELMNLNHGLLYGMGLSTPEIERAISIARDQGALGAKLTGAGGGGCIYALGQDHAHTEAIVTTLQASGFHAFIAHITPST